MASIHVPSSAPALVVIKQLTINVNVTTDAVDHVAAVHVGQEIGLPLPAVAQQLGISLDRALELIRTRVLPARLVGGVRWWARREDVERVARQQRGDGEQQQRSVAR